YATYAALVDQDSDAPVTDVDPAAPIHWNAASLAQGQQTWVWHGTDPSVADGPYVTSGMGALNAGKNLTFAGQGGTVLLHQDVDMGAGALTFTNDYRVTPIGQQTWKGAGITVNGTSNVLWQVNGVAGDSLHKLGSGTLHINASGSNAGALNVGEGTVLLDQQPDLAGNVRAFSRVDIVSGRATVVLADGRQIDPNTLYFGFRGGRLDLNGNALQFAHIHNVDNGAQLVNHNGNQAATLTLTASDARKLVLASAQNPAGERVNYDFYKGKLGEDNPALANGELNLVFAPLSADRLLELSGGSTLNGTVAVQKGTLVLSPYAELNADYSVYARPQTTYGARRIEVADTASLKVGRQISLASDIYGAAGSRISLGTVSVDDTADWQRYTPECVVADSVTCTYGAVDNQPLSTEVTGTVYLDGNSQLTLGKARLLGAVEGQSGSSVLMTGQAQWQLDRDASVGALQMQPGARLAFAGPAQHFSHLAVSDALLADGLVSMRTDLYAGKGDQLRVAGTASGDLTLAVQDIGTPAHPEARAAAYQPLVLLAQPGQEALNVTLQNGYVEAGNYRYELYHDQAGGLADADSWGLYNALLASASSAPDPVQNRWTSRRANAVISENDGYFQAVTGEQAQLQSYLERLDSDDSGLWSEVKTSANRYATDGTRLRSQRLLTRRVGADKAVDTAAGTLVAGLAIAQTTAQGQFDQGASGKGNSNTASLYGKWAWPSQLFFTGSLGYSLYDGTLRIDDNAAIDRHAWLASLGVGQVLEMGALRIQPSLMAALVYLPSSQYHVEGSAVHTQAQRAQQYRAAVSLKRTFTFDQQTLTPWLELGYSRNQRADRELVLDDSRFQSLRREDRFEASTGVALDLTDAVQFTLYGGYAHGSFVDVQRSAGLGLKWRF
ncbi:MAG: S6 family peptidase, partial [Pseudomonas sp.]